MLDRIDLSSPKQRYPRLFSAAVVVVAVALPAMASVTSVGLARIPVAEAFVPAAIRRTGRFPRHHPSFVGSPVVEDRALAMSPPTSPESDGAAEKRIENPFGIEDDDEEEEDKDNIVLHEQIKQADPEWYRKYVSDLLGEEYCTNRLPTVGLSLLESNKETVDETATESGKSENIPKESSLPKPAIAEEIDNRQEFQLSEIEEDRTDLEEEDGEIAKSEIDRTVEEDREKNAEDDVRKNEEKTDNVKVEDKEKGEDTLTPVDLKFSSAEVVQETIETPPIANRVEAIESPTTETEQAFTKTKMGQTDDGFAIGVESRTIQADLGAESRDDRRALIYRNITGQAMTCVPLVDLLELGYTVSDLGRIQAEFLSIVVLDRRRCPSMGVPPQWKVKNPRDEAEITLVGSMEEATALVNQINQEERTKRDSTSQRRRRQELRQQISIDQRQGRATTVDNGDPKIEASRPRDIDRSGRRPESRRRSGRGVPEDFGEPRRRRRSEFREDEAPPRGRDQRRRKRDRNYEGKSRKIYRVPRDDIRKKNDEGPDPPDPNSPIWVNMDTFRDLLQKEADFRLNFLGDDWADIIDEENDWRMGLYRSWLWGLNNGVGESIVPPSRYERARRRQRGRMPREPPRARPRTRPSQEPSSFEGRRRRQRDDGPPSLESRSPQEDDDPRPRRQRRARRDARDIPDADGNFKANSNIDDDNTNMPVGDAPISAAQRRSRRRAERRRRAPPDS